MTLWNAASVLFLFLLCAQAREIVVKECRLSPNVVWAWKFTFDPVHTKLTAKKPILILNASLRLKTGQSIKLSEIS